MSHIKAFTLPSCIFAAHAISGPGLTYMAPPILPRLYLGMSLQEELHQLEKDIASLQEEVGPLQEQYDHIFREVSVFEAENKHKKLSRPPVPKRVPLANNTIDFDDAPPLIHHSHFDASIEKYFNQSDEAKRSAQETDSNNDDEILAKISLKTVAGQLALRESILRFGGITAFAINDHLYDTQDDALLGLRFDVLSHTTRQFLKPHYIILRRRNLSFKETAPSSTSPLAPAPAPASSPVQNHWSVFRYTTPPHVPLDQLQRLLSAADEAAGLQSFVERVRASLVSVQYKHDKLHSLSTLTHEEVFGFGSENKVVSKIEKDLSCQRIVLWVNNHSLPTKPLQPLEIELICDELKIESVIAGLDTITTKPLFRQCYMDVVSRI
ncbi:hypothetical protein JCM33374_g2196 [Metschnikowia sp. JCM 33374]|nr:hypothetical protein JCM33374_g2196 [Metschnikowia sp. JCM 33374]